MSSNEAPTYLGLDLSTQKLKAVVVDDSFKILHQAIVQFDSDLPEFRTHGGVILDKNHPHVITAPTLMWVKALDILMDRLTVSGVDYSKIVSISGAAQQHGSVYWQNGAEETLKNLDPSTFLHEQLATSFSVTNSPIWMDSSTTKQCKELEDAVGGAQQLAEITGSRAYERFTGSQICKIAQSKPDAYRGTEKISLVSSFLCSLFLGKIAAIDIVDGSGMNLMNIHSKQWDQRLLDVCGPDLRTKLGSTVITNTILGNVANYYVERWNFSPDCKVIAFTGDNAASLIAMGLSEGWLAVSLGTSDTIFLWLQEPQVVLEGHIFCNAIDPNAFLALLCFKNGSLTRERIRNNCTEGSWDMFNQLLDSTPRGNFGNIGLYYDAQEILPFVQGDYRFNKAGDKVSRFTSLEVEVRALVEGQLIARRSYAEDIGYQLGPQTKILATGGASSNNAILQVLADVFNAPVYIQESSNSATLGAAYQAKIGLLSKKFTYKEITSCLPPPQLVCTPYPDAAEIYDPMVKRYKKIAADLAEQYLIDQKPS